MKTKKGFTLIELLAVIIILGILMIIAIPSVSEYIINSRKNAYISTISGYQSGVLQKVNSLEYSFLDLDTTYYVHINNVPVEKGGQSPFGEWVDAYVVVVYNGDTYDYYWTSIDDSGYKVQLKAVEDITVDDIMTDGEKMVSKRRAVGDRSKIVIVDKNGNYIEDTAALEYTKAEAKECFTYSVNNGKVKILDYNNVCTKSLIIPTLIEGFPVTEIDNWAFSGFGITSVKFPNTLEIIGNFGFSDNKITEVVFPSSIVRVGLSSFSNNLLTSLPDVSEVDDLSSTAFINNNIPESDWFVYKKNADGTFDYSVITGYLGSNKNVVIPESKNGVVLKKIATYAFAYQSITSVVIPESVTVIDSYAFNSNNISKLTLPKNLEYLGVAAFNANRITSVEIPESVTYLGREVFNRNRLEQEDAFFYKRNSDGSTDYSELISYGGYASIVNIPSIRNGVELKVIHPYTFIYSGITQISIPDSVINIGKHAFSGNQLIDEQAIIYKRTSSGIDYSTIVDYGGAKRVNVVFPAEKNGVSLKVIESQSFIYSGIQSLILPEGLTTIQASSLNIGLKEVVIPSTVTYIGDLALAKEHDDPLIKIVNKTGKSFNWKSITGSEYAATFETGTIKHQFGDIKVTKE